MGLDIRIPLGLMFLVTGGLMAHIWLVHARQRDL